MSLKQHVTIVWIEFCSVVGVVHLFVCCCCFSSFWLRQTKTLGLLTCYTDFENTQIPLSHFGTDATVSFDSLGGHNYFDFGTWDRDSVDCTQKRGGGWWYGKSKCAVWSNLNGIYPCCGNETGANIHWDKLVSTSPKGGAPTSTEMKIRLVDFL